MAFPFSSFIAVNGYLETQSRLPRSGEWQRLGTTVSQLAATDAWRIGDRPVGPEKSGDSFEFAPATHCFSEIRLGGRRKRVGRGSERFEKGIGNRFLRLENDPSTITKGTRPFVSWAHRPSRSLVCFQRFDKMISVLLR